MTETNMTRAEQQGVGTAGITSLPADAFEPDVTTDEKKQNSLHTRQVSYWKDVRRRFLADRAGMVSLIIILVLIFFSIFGTALSGWDIATMDFDHVSAPVGTEGHLLGTDSMGRDMFARICYGTRISLIIAFFAILLELAIGVVYGGIAGFFGGKTDEIMMRIVDIVISIPYLIVVILLMMVLKPGVRTIIIAYALTGWTEMARLVRGEIMKLRDSDFVVASRILGASPAYIIVHNMIPNMVSIIIVELTLSVPGVIFTEAFLSYIGIGVQIPIASLGTLASDGINSFQLYPAQLLEPAAVLCLIMLSFNLLGDALRDALDPRLRV